MIKSEKKETGAKLTRSIKYSNTIINRLIPIIISRTFYFIVAFNIDVYVCVYLLPC